MQKPDAEGYINVTWPSKNISYGGVFHTRIVEPSENQQKFLKVLLEESKLDIIQRHNPPLALRREDKRKPEPATAPRNYVPVVRPRTSKRRSLSAIRESGIYDMDPYCPMKRGEDRDKLKERLAKFMEHGDTQEQISPLPPLVKAKVKPPLKLPTSKEMWNDIVTQIRERTEWLAEMEYLGEASPHRDIIKDQIAERMRALDALGIESQCSTARSTDSGFSTTRSKELSPKSVKSVGSEKSVRSGQSNVSKKRTSRPPATRQKQEENVASYSQIHSPLQYSPRRRV